VKSQGSVVLLGSTGLLGGEIAMDLKGAGFSVTGLARKGTELNIDVCNTAELIRALNDLRPDVVINAAAMINLAHCENEPELAYKVNARSVSTVAEWCGEQGKNFVQISTDHLFVGQGPRLHDEFAPVTLLNEYARTKFVGEAFAATYQSALIVRTNFTGWRGLQDAPTFLEWAVSALQNQDEIIGYQNYYTSTLDTTTVARAVRELLLAGANGVFNVGAAGVTSKWEFLALLADRIGVPRSKVKPADTPVDDVRRATNLGLDSGRAEKVLGWRFPDAGTVIDNLISSANSMARG